MFALLVRASGKKGGQRIEHVQNSLGHIQAHMSLLGSTCRNSGELVSRWPPIVYPMASAEDQLLLGRISCIVEERINVRAGAGGARANRKHYL